MLKKLACIVALIVVDFFYFSTPFTFTQGLNTKQILAVLGLITFVVEFKRGNGNVPKEFLMLIIISAAISFAAYFSTIYNNTKETAYITYYTSMLVWLIAALFVAKFIKIVHGYISLRLLSRYIVIISVMQGIIAVLGDIYTPVNLFIKSLVPGTQWLDSVDRLYGIGDSTALDTGGIRYAIASILCSYLTFDEDGSPSSKAPWYFLAFALLTITGNMIARTTLTGTGIAIAYFLFKANLFKVNIERSRLRLWGWLIGILAVIITSTTILYNTNSRIHDNLRFGFEGFFSLVETGKWNVSSNNKLMEMYVFPDNAKTWIIGDGWFNNPSGDKDYLGKITGGWYMDTDVGYLRFIFLFGIIGLLLFIVFICYCAIVCMRHYPSSKLLILCILALNFVVWFKVSTDCFFIFAILMCTAFIRDVYQIEDEEEDIVPDDNQLEIA